MKILKEDGDSEKQGVQQVTKDPGWLKAKYNKGRQGMNNNLTLPVENLPNILNSFT